MTTIQDNIVAKLWSLCHVLRDDGITRRDTAAKSRGRADKSSLWHQTRRRQANA